MIRGSLRIGRRPGRGFARPADAVAQDAGDTYLSSLAKLFPVEAVTLYPLAIGIAGADEALRLGLIAAVAVFVVLLRTFATMDQAGRPDVPAIAVATISFLLYVASLGGFGWLAGGEQQTTQVASFVTIMWVALVPYILHRRAV